MALEEEYFEVFCQASVRLFTCSVDLSVFKHGRGRYPSHQILIFVHVGSFSIVSTRLHFCLQALLSYGMKKIVIEIVNISNF